MKSLQKASNSSTAAVGQQDTRDFEAAALLSSINHHLSHPPPQIQLKEFLVTSSSLFSSLKGVPAIQRWPTCKKK